MIVSLYLAALICGNPCTQFKIVLIHIWRGEETESSYKEIITRVCSSERGRNKLETFGSGLPPHR